MGALYFNTQQTFEALQATRDELKLSEQGQLTDRFSKAVELLGNNDNLEVRLGGIYALGRIAHDSVRDRPAVMEVLSAYVREHAPLSLCSDVDASLHPAVDVQAILTVLSRPDTKQNRGILHLDQTCLQGANLPDADFSQAFLSYTDLSKSNLSKANFSEAHLSSVDLPGAILTEADFSKAELHGGVFSAADLRGADLSGTILMRADLSGADLSGADLSGADLSGAHLSQMGRYSANLSGANLDRTQLSGLDLAGVDLSDVNLR